jgi:hypothetical protein
VNACRLGNNQPASLNELFGGLKIRYVHAIMPELRSAGLFAWALSDSERRMGELQRSRVNGGSTCSPAAPSARANRPSKLSLPGCRPLPAVLSVRGYRKGVHSFAEPDGALRSSNVRPPGVTGSGLNWPVAMFCRK